MFTWFRDLRFPVVVLVLGFILVIAGFFQVSDITKLSIIPHPGPLYGVIGIGIALIIVSIVLFHLMMKGSDIFLEIFF